MTFQGLNEMEQWWSMEEVHTRASCELLPQISPTLNQWQFSYRRLQESSVS
jgi:hypothetical protein